MYRPISDYGAVGNLQTVALVGRHGSIDWFCYPYLDSPAVFAALLDHERGGRFAVAPDLPDGEWDGAARYLERSNVLRTRFRTRQGVAEVLDFMDVPACGPEENECAASVLYRRVRVEQGRVALRVRFEPRFDYARAAVDTEALPGGVLARGGGRELALTATEPLQAEPDGASAVWALAAGDEVWLRLGATGPEATCSEQDRSCVTRREGEAALEQTLAYWRAWLERSETGRDMDWGAWEPMVQRSALVLKMLFYEPSGAMAAAATTSLPEEVGGVRNWDYRYTWVRDTAFTLQALYNLGHLSETEGYLRWVEQVLEEGRDAGDPDGSGAGTMQIMYGLRGERDLAEQSLDHLDGYKGSRPVRIGNGAAAQRQLDIYGELMDAMLKLSDYVGKIREEQWPVLRGVCEHVADHWRMRDAGIWEVRGGPRHFVYSKVMCWVALDRGLAIADRYGFPCDREHWQRTMREIREEVLERGWDPELGAFVQHYGSKTLDAANLLLPILGFLPFEDQRVVSTIEATRRELERDGLLHRYNGEDGLQGGEGAFLLCSFWLVDCLVALGRLDQAEALLRRLERTANHLGLFSEEYGVEWDEALGNVPQAFTHIGYVNSVMRLLRARREQEEEQQEDEGPGLARRIKRKLLAPEVVLNRGEPEQRVPDQEIAPRLKQTMNLLRGAYFDTARGRVAYEDMAGSDLYATYTDLSRTLRFFDPARLRGREERTAFWINLFNVIVIHGVVELDIRDSVKEVRGFFRRICYDLGGLTYAAADMEHGILRANRRPPHSLLRRFGHDDPRLEHSLETVDPRIHFALVCASSSCPPIGLYTAEGLDSELDTAAKTFCNAGGVQVDMEQGLVRLSRVFSWYDEDFGETTAERLAWLAGFLYAEDERAWLLEHQESATVEYQDYDWRLNRTDAGPDHALR